MVEGGGGEGGEIFLLQLSRLLGGHTKTIGMLGQGTPRLSWYNFTWGRIRQS